MGLTTSMQIIEEGHKLVVIGNVYTVKEQIKQIEGYRWNPMRRCWIVPNTSSNKQKLDLIKRNQK